MKKISQHTKILTYLKIGKKRKKNEIEGILIHFFCLVYKEKDMKDTLIYFYAPVVERMIEI